MRAWLHATVAPWPRAWELHMPWLHGDGSMHDLRVTRDRAVEAWIRTVASGQQPRRNVLAEYHVTSDGACAFLFTLTRGGPSLACSR